MNVRNLLVIVLAVVPTLISHACAKQEMQHFSINGVGMDVGVYRPPVKKQAPMIVVVHGFSRSRHHMRGWGEKLAAEGFVVLIPTLPYLADHRKNANAIVQLISAARDGTLLPDFPKITSVALVGFSMGGLVTLLAGAALEPPLDAWVGLDPADSGGLGAAAASRITAPGLIFEADRDRFNLKKSRTGIMENYGGTLKIFQVPDSTHADVETHPDLLAELVFGKTSPARHEEVYQCTLKFLLENVKNTVR